MRATAILPPMPLSHAQVTAYLDRIDLADSDRVLLSQGPDGPHALEAISRLQSHHIRAIPFENLSLGYSSHHSLPQDTDSVFDHVVNLKRGGVCDQIHLLFTQLVRHFRFSVYCAGSRINSAAGIFTAAGRVPAQTVDPNKPNFGPW